MSRTQNPDITREDYPPGFTLTDTLHAIYNFEEEYSREQGALPVISTKRCLNFQRNSLTTAIETLHQAEFYLNIQPTIKPLFEALLKIVNRLYRSLRSPRTDESINNVLLYNADSKLAWLTLIYSTIRIELNKPCHRDLANLLYEEVESLREHIKIAEYHRDCAEFRGFEADPSFTSVMTPGYWLYNMKPVTITMTSFRNTTDDQLHNYQRALTLGNAVLRHHIGSRSDIRAFALRAVAECIEETYDDRLPTVSGNNYEAAYLELTRKNLENVKEKLIVRANDRRLESGLALAINEEVQAVHKHIQTIEIQRRLVLRNPYKCMAICGAVTPLETYQSVIRSLNFGYDDGYVRYNEQSTRLPTASITGYSNNSNTVNRWEVTASDRGQITGVSLNGKTLNAASVNVRSEPGSIVRLSIEVVITPGQDVLNIVGGGINDTAIVEEPSVRYERHVDF